MPPIKGQKKLAEAVFTSVQEGSYSADQDVASAELPSAALESLSSLLEQARVDVKNSISELSRLSARDIDGWISQAKQLRQDISRSEQHSREIVTVAESGQSLREQAQDALAKVSLLESEVSFNDTVVEALKDIAAVKTKTDAANAQLKKGGLLEATKLVKQVEAQVAKLDKTAGTRLIQVIKDRIQKTRISVVEVIEESWSKLVQVETDTRRFSILKQTQVSIGPITLEQLCQALDSLDMLQDRTSILTAQVDGTILNALLQKGNAGGFNIVSKEKDIIELAGNSKPTSMETTFENIEFLQSFCYERLPTELLTSFTPKLNTRITERLLSSSLTASIPLDLSGLPEFQKTIEQVRAFARSLDNKSKGSTQKLLSWTDNAPNVWLAKKSEGSLNSIRQLLKRGLGRPRQVERVETEVIKHNDDAFPTNGAQKDWDDRWSDDEEMETKDQIPVSQAKPSNGAPSGEDDEDVSGWGFDDDEQQTGESAQQATQEHENDKDDTKEGPDDNDEDEAWGWGDEAESPSQTQAQLLQSQARPGPQTSGTQTKERKPQDREITLRETYHITALPEQIVDVLVMVIEDADSLSRMNSSNLVASAAKDLYLLPGALLSMFRASAPTFYGNDISGSMFLYNDCIYLAQQLRSYIMHHQNQHPQDRSLSSILEKDIPDLEVFGKRAYGKDMDSKRTTITDLLDGAQGFSNCTQEPFASQCDLAVSSVVDYLRQVHGQWSSVLSSSALLQSIGSLLNTVIRKIIIDIEDMNDISVEESQRLVSFCRSISSLEDLFMPETDGSSELDEMVVPQTPAFCNTWLRFQYLSNILDSSLADIKYLWTEAGLSMEFTVDEVVDLIEALFAPSDHRREAISEIRRSR